MLNTLIRSTRRNVLVSTLIIFVCAALFRLTYIDYIEFKADEAINLYLASQPLFGNPLPPGGTVSSIGILNPPLFTYLLFPLTFISLDPRFVTFVIALTNCLAITFLFLFLRKYYGLLISFTTSILLSFSPWAVLFSRKIWTQDVILPFFVIFVFVLHKAVLEREKYYWFWFGMIAVLLVQLHQINIAFVVLVSVLLLIKRISISLKYLSIGIFVGSLFILPYIVYQLQNACPDCQAVLQLQGRLSPMWSVEIFSRLFQIIGQGMFYTIFGNDLERFSASYRLAYQMKYVFYLAIIVTPIGIYKSLKINPLLQILTIATVSLPVIYFILRIDAFIHYFIIILPILFFLLAYGFATLIRSTHKVIRIIGVGTLAIYLIASFLYTFSFFDFVAKKRSLAGDYGATYIQSSKEAKALYSHLQKLDSKDFEQLILASYMPRKYLFGSMPIGRLLFPKVLSKEEIMALDRKLEKQPYDPRVLQTIHAQLTKQKLTRHHIENLRKDYSNSNFFPILYPEIYGSYLQATYKKAYTSSLFHLTLELPQHWTVEESNRLSILGDGYLLTISSLEMNENLFPLNSKEEVENIIVNGEKVKKTTCIEISGYWCGTRIILTRDNRHVLISYDKKETSNRSAMDTTLREQLQTLEDIVTSIY